MSKISIAYLTIIGFSLMFHVNIYAGSMLDTSVSTSSAEFRGGVEANFNPNMQIQPSIFFSKNKDINIGLALASLPIGDTNSPFLLSAHIGLEATHYATNKEYLLYGVELGGIGYRFLTSVPTAIFIDLAIAPEVLNWGVAEFGTKAQISYDIMLNPYAVIYFGARDYRLFFSSKDYVLIAGDDNSEKVESYALASNIIFGLRLNF